MCPELNPGILYNVLVARPAMYWPSTLVIVQLFTTLFDETASASSSAARRLTSKRLQVFVLIFLATFIYQVSFSRQGFKLTPVPPVSAVLDAHICVCALPGEQPELGHALARKRLHRPGHDGLLLRLGECRCRRAAVHALLGAGELLRRPDRDDVDRELARPKAKTDTRSSLSSSCSTSGTRATSPLQRQRASSTRPTPSLTCRRF